MTRTTSSPSESIAVLKVSTMDAQYQTNARQCGRRARRSIRGKGLTPYLNLAQGGPRQMLAQWCLLISIRQTLMSARSGLERAFSVAMAPENSIDGLKHDPS